MHPPVDVRRPPDDFDDVIEWFDRVSANLVLLEPYRLGDLRVAVDRFVRELDRHISTTRAGSWAGSDDGTPEEDHARFRPSLGELRGLLAVVARDDHGGNRQALGQYGRLVVEALRAHRTLERSLPEHRRATVAGGRARAP